jgi:hypothetical protein
MSELTRQDCLSTFQEAFRGTIHEAQARRIATKAIDDDDLFQSILRWLAISSRPAQNTMFLQTRKENVLARHR